MTRTDSRTARPSSTGSFTRVAEPLGSGKPVVTSRWARLAQEARVTLPPLCFRGPR